MVSGGLFLDLFGDSYKKVWRDSRVGGCGWERGGTQGESCWEKAGVQRMGKKRAKNPKWVQMRCCCQSRGEKELRMSRPKRTGRGPWEIGWPRVLPDAGEVLLSPFQRCVI